MIRSLLALASLITPPLAAQTQPQTLFPGLLGEELRVAVADAYTPVSVLTLDQSKDTLYAVIDREERGGQAGAAGIYSEYFVAFDCVPNCDPSQDVYNGGSGLSQEHTWPRSQGAGSGLFERDLHHLFPSKQSVNAARGNLPFGESPDAETSTWYYLAQTQSSPPPEDERDLWSERLGSTLFEPREGREGDVARAMFYAYAIYGPDGNGQANPDFWDQMEPYLLAWHRQDPATADDLARGDRVARYQATASGEPAFNPFVVDSSLAARAFYPETLPSSSEPPAVAGAPLTLEMAGPNPFRDRTALTLTLAAPAQVRVEVYDALGRRVAVLFDGPSPVRLSVAVDASGWRPGAYFVRASTERSSFVRALVLVW